MKKQDKEFREPRDELKHVVVMRRLNLKMSTYHKLMGVKTNNVVNAPLSDWEVDDIHKALDTLEEKVKRFRDALHDND